MALSLLLLVPDLNDRLPHDLSVLVQVEKHCAKFALAVRILCRHSKRHTISSYDLVLDPLPYILFENPTVGLDDLLRAALQRVRWTRDA
jgi:hypothetical protein